MKPLVVLNSWSAIKEAMAMKELSGRPGMFSGTFFQKGKTGRNFFHCFVKLSILNMISEIWYHVDYYPLGIRYMHNRRKDMGTPSGFLSWANEDLLRRKWKRKTRLRRSYNGWNRRYSNRSCKKGLILKICNELWMTYNSNCAVKFSFG